MKNLLLSSFLVCTIYSCTLGHYKKLIPVASTEALPLKPIFGDHFNSFLFKTNLTVYGKRFSGLLVTKQLQPADYRVIFTTELGMKLFDFEFTDTAFTLHYCVPQFNRPALLKTIQQDLEILLMTKRSSQTITYLKDEGGNYTIGKTGKEKFCNYYFREQNSLHLLKIEHAKGQVKKTTFVLEKYTDDIPERIVIQHHDIKLKIELALLKK